MSFTVVMKGPEATAGIDTCSVGTDRASTPSRSSWRQGGWPTWRRPRQSPGPNVAVAQVGQEGDYPRRDGADDEADATSWHSSLSTSLPTNLSKAMERTATACLGVRDCLAMPAMTGMKVARATTD